MLATLVIIVIGYYGYMLIRDLTDKKYHESVKYGKKRNEEFVQMISEWHKQ